MKIYYRNITIDLSKLPKNRPRFGDDVESQDRKYQWIFALWSGFYEQGRYVLYNDFTNSYCCLGVKVELEGGRLFGCYYNGTEKCINRNGTLPYGVVLYRNRQTICLAQLNDAYLASFKEIAFVIQHIF